jgi:hypothetical protein
MLERNGSAFLLIPVSIALNTLHGSRETRTSMPPPAYPTSANTRQS